MKQIKKHFVWLLCAVLCLMSLTACAKAEEQEAPLDPQTTAYMVQTAGDFLEEVATMEEGEMGMIIDQQLAEPGVISGLESYMAVKSDLGALVSVSGQGTVSEVEGGYEIAVDAQFEKRVCQFVLGVDEDIAQVTSMAFNPVYSLGENMTKAALNTLMGMGTVFVVLIFISLLISCFKYINVIEKKMKEKKAAPAPQAAAAPAPVPAAVPAPAEEDVTDDLELVAVITAAIAAASENTVPADGLVVRSIRRVPNSKWKNA